ncbi:cable pilus major pilin CblA [Burkholderia lata]|uniref:Giant cable pilus n=1 Tax=Burkholderia lata (strain ATCC 17760 / DSM 23089 / LMG 22485 / NCIMB 9086 / R18194 / 383) TaxID=482957 RepID=A0A6P2SGL7_BURL3|nr:cable pilus major pilin CblA [Burkholderia lata]VWC47143.1 giant cable pilus [Burkholderia lata]
MLKIVPIAAAALFSMSAFAVQKDITVTANVDPTLEILTADGSALPSSVAMSYMPGKGLQTKEVMTKIFSNDKTKDLQVRLATDAVMTNVTSPGATSIPLSVKLGNDVITTEATTVKAATIFLGDLSQGSSALPLSISQKTPGEVAEAGNYLGVVSLVVTQAAAAEK